MKKKERLEFKAFVEENLDDSMGEYKKAKLPPYYNFEDLLVLRHDDPNVEDFGIIFQNTNWTQDATLSTISSLKRSNITPIQIFYKDGENFFKRLAQSGYYRSNKAFKRYSMNDINNMVHLRQNEKMDISKLGSGLMTYYQEPTQRLEQSLRFYLPKDVILDHSHVENDFAKGGLSTDYKIMEELWRPSTSNFQPIRNTRGKVTLKNKDF